MHAAPLLTRQDAGHRAAPWARTAGFTLTELLIVIVILTLLSAMTSFTLLPLIASIRTESAASELRTTFVKARSFALARNTAITISPKSNAWSNGWQVLDANGNLLDDHGPSTDVTISGPSSTVTYLPSGRLPTASAAPTYVLTSRTDQAISQCLSLDLSGRPYLKEGTSC